MKLIRDIKEIENNIEIKFVYLLIASFEICLQTCPKKATIENYKYFYVAQQN